MLKEYLEKRERGLQRNKHANWEQRLFDAIAARAKWDEQVRVCNRIRSNDIPIGADKSKISEYTNKFYRDNWILKANIWKESYIQAADLLIEVKSRATADDTDPNREFLEMEVNYTMDEFNMVRDTPDVISDWVWYGFGVSYLPWNTMRADKNWRTGVPEFRYHPCQSFWVDPNANQYGWKNRRWQFAKFSMDIDEAKELFPDHADKIADLMGNPDFGDSPERKEIFDIYLCQYRSNARIEMVDVTWIDQGQEYYEQIYAKEIDEFLANVEEGRHLPDNIYVGERYTVEKECWYQFFFSPAITEPLSEIEYIGNKDHFQILWGMKMGNNIYPVNWTYLLADMLDIKTVAMTLAAVQAIKNGNPMPMVEEGAIKDMVDFVQNRNSLDYVAQISEEWRLQHPQETPVKFAEGRFDANIMMMLNNYITEAIKSSTGSIDTARGEAQYSGQSGVQTAQLQSAAAIYTKQDELSFKDYLKQISELLLQYIGEFRTYEHKLNGINDFGQDETMTINRGDVSTWNWEQYYTVPMVENTPEMMKQLKRQEALQLRSQGAISNLDLLRMLDYPNAMQLEENRIRESQVMQLAQFLTENPEVMNAIMSGTGSGGGVTESEGQVAERAK